MPPIRKRQSRRWYHYICLVSNADSSDSSESVTETQDSPPINTTMDDHLFPPPETPSPVTRHISAYAAHSVTEDEDDWRLLIRPPPPPLILNQPVSESSEVGIVEVESQHRSYGCGGEKVMDEIRSMKITEVLTREKTICPICKEEFRLGNEAAKLRCNHFFCFECIRAWLNKNNTCPVCRRHLHYSISRDPQSSEWDYFFPPFPHDILTGSQVVADESERSTSQSLTRSDEADYDTARDEPDESEAYPPEETTTNRFV